MGKPTPTCRKCQKTHWPFQKCEVKDNVKQTNLGHWKTHPHLHEGWRVWGDQLETYEKRGETIVQQAGIRMPPRLGRLTEPSGD